MQPGRQYLQRQPRGYSGTGMPWFSRAPEDGGSHVRWCAKRVVRSPTHHAKGIHCSSTKVGGNVFSTVTRSLSGPGNVLPAVPVFRPSFTRPRTPPAAGPFLQLQNFPARLFCRLSPDFFVFALSPPIDPKRPFFLIAGPATNLLQLQNFPAACSRDIFICQNILPESNFHALAVGAPRPSSTAVRKRPPGRWKQAFGRHPRDRPTGCTWTSRPMGHTATEMRVPEAGRQRRVGLLPACPVQTLTFATASGQ